MDVLAEVFSAVICFLVENLISKALEIIAPHNGIDAEIKNLHRSLTLIQDVLADASRKEITSQAVRRWLNDLQHLAYEIDDVLDDLATDAMEEEFARESETLSRKLRKLVSDPFTNVPKKKEMLDKIKSINAKLQELLKDRPDLGSSDGPTNSHKNRKCQSSVFDPSRIVGRVAEKQEFVRLLLQPDGLSDQNFGIVPIIGMGGVGKTTLARLLYDDQHDKDHFELKGWICISDDFCIFGRTKDIFNSMGGELKKEHEDFNKLQEALKYHVWRKRFLLVLDDVWCESYADWENLVRPLCACASGSKIIITTRKDQLIKQLEGDRRKQLQHLSQEDALSLLALHALDKPNFDSHLLLKPHTAGIVKNCGGSPLALTALGRSLREKKNDVEHWKKVSNREMWRLDDIKGLLRALKLSYNELSAPLKQVFAYCSLFPKDFLFDKEALILLWMAEGFLNHPAQGNRTKERLGCEYFDQLVSRSFFQYAPNNEPLFVMNELMNDLATHVAGEFFIRLDIEAKKDDIEETMLEKYRHMSFVCKQSATYKNFEAYERAKSLRTFLATSAGVVNMCKNSSLSNKIVVDFVSELPLLRVLSLSHLNISEVPEFIGTLRHLRYLNLSQTGIKDLPESISNLYNLETLILSGCSSLAKLPNNFSKLKNLRHLDIRDTRLNQMPLGMDELTSLKTLSN